MEESPLISHSDGDPNCVNCPKVYLARPDDLPGQQVTLQYPLTFVYLFEGPDHSLNSIISGTLFTTSAPSTLANEAIYACISKTQSAPVRAIARLKDWPSIRVQWFPTR